MAVESTPVRGRWEVVVLFALAIAVIVPLVTFSAASAGNRGKPDGWVTICHRTADVGNPYNQMTVSIDSADGEGQGDHYRNHTGPLWRPWFQQGDSWGDIIPPIPGVHGGLNWSAAGRLLWRKGCEPGLPPTPTPTPTPTTPPPPPPPPTTAPPTTAPPQPPTPAPPTTAPPTTAPPTTAPPTTAPPPPGKPEVPIIIVPGGEVSPGDWVDVLEEVKAAGSLTVKVTCTVNGVRKDQLCRTAIKKRKVRVKALCSDNIEVRVRVVARRDGFTTQRWNGTWRVDSTDNTYCRSRGNG